MGTNFSREIHTPDPSAPVLAPVSDAQALREAAAALTKLTDLLGQLVSALQGRLATAPAPAATHPRLNTAADPATVTNAINAFLIAKARAGKSDRYLRAMKNSLTKFSRDRSTRFLDDVTVEEVEKWLSESDWNSTTKRGYLRDLRTLYHFAVRRGMTINNAPYSVELPRRAASVIGIHTPAETAAVLECARKMDLNVCRAMAVRYFTGLRSSECDKLTEDCIRLDTGFIEVTARNAKTRQRRLVDIEPNLRAWLALGGQLPLHDVGRRMRLLVKACGVPWPNNVTRHSFVSYSVAKLGAKETALRAGHSEDMLFRHYRALVTKAQAEEYFATRPT